MTGDALPPLPAVAHVALFRALDAGYVAVFVEGPDDVAFWRHWLRWPPHPAGGITKVREALKALRIAGEKGFVGIVDADCERLERGTVELDDLLVTETMNLEGDLLKSTSAVSRLASTIAHSLTPEEIRDLATEFGYLRWHFYRINREYPDGRLSPYAFVKDMKCDSEGLCDEAARHLASSTADLQAHLDVLKARQHDGWLVCNGHDLVAILTVILRSASGKRFPRSEAVQTSIILAVESRDLVRLHLWRALGRWEETHPPWQVRKQFRVDQ